MEKQPLHEAGWQIVDIDGKNMFKVPEDLKFIKKVGSDAFGIVASFSKPDGSKIGVKKITGAFYDLHDARKTVQEIMLTRKLKHPNILALQDIYPPESPTFSDIYVVSELMETDLHRVIYSKQQLTEGHHQCFCCQILYGLRYLHAAHVVHCGLKPRNLLINRNCDLKISAFSSARRVGPNTFDDHFSEFVVCRWYSGPEAILMNSACSPSIDIWSVGCILGELIGRKPVFSGKDRLDQVKKMLKIVGSPSEAELDWLPSVDPARSFMRKLGQLPKQPWSAVYPQGSTSAHEALEAMLTFHPHHRIEAAAALELPYFETFHEESHFTVNCHNSDSEHIKCTSLASDVIGIYRVPEEGEEASYTWLAKKVAEAMPGYEGTLSIVNHIGEVVCTQHVEKDSEPIEEPVDWIYGMSCLSQRQLQNDVYRECWKLRPWIAERDQQQLQELGIALLDHVQS